LIGYVQAFSPEWQNPTYFYDLIGEDLQASDEFWSRWFSAFPQEVVIKNEELFDDFVIARYTSWLERRSHRRYPVRENADPYAVINEVGAECLDHNLIPWGDEAEWRAIWQ
jgi:hypothetical protein